MTIKNHLPLLGILIGLVVLAWHKVLFQSITGEGYWYFVYPLEGGTEILRFDIGAEVVMAFLMSIFRDNIPLYQGFLLIIWMFICISFYFLVLEITNKKQIAFIASLFFGVSYTTAFEMLGMGAYQNFLQRVLFIVLIFPSFIFFIKFHKTFKTRYFLLSLLFFVIGVFSAHFNTFLLPFLMIYVLYSALFIKNSPKRKALLVSHLLLFAGINLLIIYLAKLYGVTSYVKGSFIQYVLNNAEFILTQSVRQLVFLTLPFNAFGDLLSAFEFDWIKNVSNFYLPVLIVYIAAFVFMFKREKQLRIAFISSLLFLPAIFVLNLYMRADNVQFLESGSRYLFVPSLAFAIFWGIFFYSLSKVKKMRNVVYLFLVYWVFLQVSLVWGGVEKEYYKHKAINKSLKYIKSISPGFKDDSIIIVPSVVGPWGSAFSQKFYGRKNTSFVPMWGVVVVWKDVAKRPFDPKKDWIVHYDYEKEKIVDKTNSPEEVIILDTK